MDSCFGDSGGPLFQVSSDFPTVTMVSICLVVAWKVMDGIDCAGIINDGVSKLIFFANDPFVTKLKSITNG